MNRLSVVLLSLGFVGLPVLADDALPVTVVPVSAPAAVSAPAIPTHAEPRADEAMKSVLYLKDGSGVVIDGVLYRRPGPALITSPASVVEVQQQQLEIQKQQLAAQQQLADQQAAAVKQSRRDQRRLRAVMGQGLLPTIIQKWQDDHQP